MGLDLRLLPCEHWDAHNWGFSHTILTLGRLSYDVYDAFEASVKPHVQPMPAGHNISSYIGKLIPDGRAQGERYYGTIRAEDAYGTPYTFVTAQHLLPWLEEHFRYDGSQGHGPYQASIVAYMCALPPDTKIVLDWH